MNAKLFFSALLLTVLSLTSGLVSAQGKRGGKAKKAAPAAAVAGPAVTVIGNDELRQLLTRKPGQHPFLVNFWATWCEPCVAEFPELVKLNEDYRARGLDFITISLDEMSDLKTGVPRFLKKTKSTMPAYLLKLDDQEAAFDIIDKDWIGALPLTLLYDSNGKVIYKKVGRLKIEELRAALDQQFGSQ